MTYNVFGATLNPAQLIYISQGTAATLFYSGSINGFTKIGVSFLRIPYAKNYSNSLSLYLTVYKIKSGSFFDTRCIHSYVI